MRTNRYSLPPGTVLDERYVIGEVLGEGGFGITYAGENRRIGLRVAIKEFFCREYMSRDAFSSSQISLMDDSFAPRLEKEKSRFLKEARILSDFSAQPGIVHVTDYFEANGTAYIVMSFLTGKTLRSCVEEEGRMDPDRLFSMVKPLLESLGQVHRAGLLHRDISPGNIMLLEDGTLCLIDFGAAFRYDSKEVSATLIAKQGYTPPEQYSSMELTPASDLYALCATLYYCVCGVPPQDSLQRMLLDELAAPRTLGAALPEKVEAVIMKGLTLQPEGRWQSADELRAAITEIWPDSEKTDDKKGRRRRIITVGIAAAAAAAAAAGGIFLWTHRTQIRFRGIPTQTLRFIPGDEMTASDYTQSKTVVKGRVEAFAGRDNFLWTETEDGIEVVIPREILKGKDPDYVCKCYLTRPLEFYLAPDGEQPLEEKREAAVHIARGQLEEAAADETIKERFAQEIKDLGYEDPSVMVLTLDDKSADAVRETLGDVLDEAGGSLRLYYDLNQDFSTFYYNSCISVGDGRSVCVLNRDREGSFEDTMQYFTAHETARTPFYISNDPVVNWEDPAASMTAGEYQVREEEIGGDYLLLTLSFSSAMEDGKAAWFHNVIALKERLDALEQPYAAGLIGYDTRAFVIKTVPDAFTQEELMILIGGTFSLKAGSKWSSYDVLYGLSWNRLDSSDGKLTFSLSDYDRKDALKSVKELKADGASEAYLFGGYTLPLASIPLDELEKMLDGSASGTDGGKNQITFSNLTFSYDPTFVSYLRSCGREDLDDSGVSVQALRRYYAGKGTFPLWIDTKDLPEQFSSIYEGQEELIRQIEDFTAKAEGQITTKSDRAEGLTVSFWFYDLEDEKIPEFAADFAADLCELIKEPMQQGEIAHLYFYFDVNEEGNEDRERLYFSINKYYSERHMQMYEVVSNNTKADDDEVLEMLVSRLGKIEGLENLVPENAAVE